jgi:uncharacterized protein (TIGR00369 family)
MENMEKTLPVSDSCFVCGVDNPVGLGMQFFIMDGMVASHWRPAEKYCGYKGVVHGGVLAAAFDEAMAWAAARELGRMCVTGELTVRYLQRTPGDREYLLKTRVIEPGKRRVIAYGVLVDDSGTEYADARGKFVPLTAEETLRVDDGLIYRPTDERIFDELRAKFNAPHAHPHKETL